MSNIFRYNDQDITFDIGNGDVMVNATEMGKSFGKNVRQWFENIGTHEFIHYLAKHKGLTSTGKIPTSLNASTLADIYPSLMKVVKGGNILKVSQGTWFHEDVAIEFARWLSPEFAIWCNERIKELMRHGFTATPDKIDDLIANPDLLINMATALKKERQEKEQLSNELNKTRRDLQFKDQVLEESLPKLDYHDKVLRSTTLLSTTEVAKSIGTNAVALNKKLNELKVIYKHDGTWLPYSKYEKAGLGKLVVYPYFDRLTGETKTSRTWKWTEKGLKFISGLIEIHDMD